MAFRLTFLILLTTLLGCTKEFYTVVNKGVGGNTTHDLLKRVEPDVISLDPDIVVIMVGTNDMVNSGKFISYRDFSENYQNVIKKLTAPGRSIVLMSSPPVDTSYLFKRHDRHAFSEDPNSKIDSANRIVLHLASDHALHFIDINSAFRDRNSPNPEASSLIMNYSNSQKEDGIHPTKEGYRLIANEVYQLLKKKNLLTKNCTIVCFGDSITFGAFMDGAGTGEGETYPAMLKKMLLPDFHP